MTAAELAPPRGWFAVAFGAQLRRGRVVTATVNGREVVVFRTRAGRVAALDPVCPHLGAHLGVGGTVEGESLRCPFHGFRFAPDGTCTATGYGTPPPAGLAVGAWPVVERGGAVLVWSDPAGGPPTWTVPEVDERGWSSWRTRRLELRTHPQETTENAADLGHFAAVHRYVEVEVFEPLTADGPTLRARYGMLRPFRPLAATRLGRALGIRTRFAVEAHGLGWSLVHADVPALRLSTRQLVLATPTGPGRTTLRLALSVRRPWAERGGVRGALGAAIGAVVARAAVVAFVHDVRQDEPVWNHKVHLPRPRLARGDGPIGPYRRWARQFTETAAPAVDGEV